MPQPMTVIEEIRSRRYYVRKDGVKRWTRIVSLRLSRREEARLEMEANARGISFSSLVRMILDRCMDDNLFNAILDDVK